MERIGSAAIWSYFDSEGTARPASNPKICRAEGHRVGNYWDLAKKVAELQFLNRDHVLLFRGQKQDHRTSKGNSMLKASLGSNRQPSRCWKGGLWYLKKPKRNS